MGTSTKCTALITPRMINMNRSSICSYSMLALAVSIQLPALAQAGMQQQMTNYSAGTSPASAVNRNQASGPVTLPTADLRVVPENFSDLKLAPGFLVRLTVLDDSDYSGDYRIDDQGNIAVPILGALHISGETSAGARALVTQRLRDEQILKNPQVNLSILEYTAPQVTIIGEVSAPGKYPLLIPRNLVDVLALAGGPTNFAGNEVQITPNGDGTKSELVHYSKATNPETVKDVLVHPGDTVQVKRAGIIYVLGAVNRPGGYVMQEDGSLNLLQAISLANGTSVVASTGTIHLLRKNPDGSEVDISLPYKEISHGKRADYRLQSQDILFVPTSKTKSVLYNGQSVFAAAASASIYAATF
jgi:polysaccharide biosynthesis/export protein